MAVQGTGCGGVLWFRQAGDLTGCAMVGENGSGKSTLVEAIALVYGLSPEGGSTGARHGTRPTESGESFLELAISRFRGPGLWVLDEPESALSFSGCLSLLAVLKDLLADGNSQVIMSTHSPVLAALAGAQILEVGTWSEIGSSAFAGARMI